MEQPTINIENNAQQLLNQIAIEYYKDKRRKRRSKMFRRIVLTFIILGVVLSVFYQHLEEQALRIKAHVGLIDIKGEIIDSQVSSSDSLMKSLTDAYASKGLKALIFRIDSPGGSPVQADYMFNAIKYFRLKYPEVKTFAVCVDTCASAAYYVAASADKIYANPASLVGSIGVLYNGFGFVDTMQKLGVSRRLKTAGRNKGFMDPFSPIDAQQEATLATMLDSIHNQFIKQVKKGRGDRLKINDDTFSGLIWTGIQAKDLGLIDGFASSGQLIRKVIKIEDVVDYTEKHNMLEQFADKLGSSMLNSLPEALGLMPGFK
jgi:protease-4